MDEPVQASVHGAVAGAGFSLMCTGRPGSFDIQIEQAEHSPNCARGADLIEGVSALSKNEHLYSGVRHIRANAAGISEVFYLEGRPGLLR